MRRRPGMSPGPVRIAAGPASGDGGAAWRFATEGVYVAYFSYGSPATRYGLWAGRRVVEVNETPTPDLQAFIDAREGVSSHRAVGAAEDGHVEWDSRRGDYTQAGYRVLACV